MRKVFGLSMVHEGAPYGNKNAAGPHRRHGTYTGKVTQGDIGHSGARANFNGSISVDKSTLKGMNHDDKIATIAHEIAHQTVEKHYENDPTLWSKRFAPVSAKMAIGEKNGKTYYYGWHPNGGEAVMTMIGYSITGKWPKTMQKIVKGKVVTVPFQRNLKTQVNRLIKDSGYSARRLRTATERSVKELE